MSEKQGDSSTSMTVTAGAGVLKPLPDKTLASPDDKAFLSSRGVLKPSFASFALASGGSVTFFFVLGYRRDCSKVSASRCNQESFLKMIVSRVGHTEAHAFWLRKFVKSMSFEGMEHAAHGNNIGHPAM